MTRIEENILWASDRYWGYDTMVNMSKFKVLGVSSTYIKCVPICVTKSFLVSSNILLSYFLLHHAVILIEITVD